ncbi:MAG: 50S ribosomal protein L13 [Candidatus Lambdaproteobacteria bacterium]|nr:50S ribosomal protein L13 [Candidatus Lambdaproteobacteria bacterium]
MRTVSIRKEQVAPGAEYAPQWLLVDAAGKPLGRVASQIAHLLRGKHKPIFTPHLDTGDFVVVVNAEKVVLTGAKMQDKYYYHHTRFQGGMKTVFAEKLLAKKPTELLRLAVKRMLPKNGLNRDILHHKLKLYAGPEHPHAAQRPQPYTLPY